jgi:hypothetical protein
LKTGERLQALFGAACEVSEEQHCIHDAEVPAMTRRDKPMLSERDDARQ